MNNYFNFDLSTEEIANELFELADIKPGEELHKQIDDAIYHLKTITENEYNHNPTYLKKLYSLLTLIAGKAHYSL